MTFKELRTQLSKLQQSSDFILYQLRNQPFWIWDQKEHLREYTRTNGDCCFNHVAGLPKKDKKEFSLFDYEKFLYDSLLISDFNNPLRQDFKHKHLWVKKATALGITEFILRMMAWLCTRYTTFDGSQMCVMTGPNIETGRSIHKIYHLVRNRKISRYSNSSHILTRYSNYKNIGQRNHVR